MKQNILIVEDEFIVANDLRHILTKAGYEICGIAASVNEALELINKKRPAWVLLDIFLQDGSKGTELAAHLSAKNIGFLYISANTNQTVLEQAKATGPYGFVVKPFREKDLLIMLEIAMEKHRLDIDFISQREMMLRQQLSLFCEALIPAEEKLRRLPGIFQPVLSFDLFSVSISRGAKTNNFRLSFLRTGFDEYQQLTDGELSAMTGTQEKDIQAGNSFCDEPENKADFLNGTFYQQHLSKNGWERQLSNKFRLASRICYTYRISDKTEAMLTFYSKKADGFSGSSLSILSRNNEGLKNILNQVTGNVPVPVASERPVPATAVPEIIQQSGKKFEGIVGNSPALLKVLDNISLVSKTDISVLISGDSGTGKEKVAQNIHRLSARKLHPFITVNCAALPHDLIESELFGHEKGAFTGAMEKRIGKFELADGGTIFLDEIGEMPPEAQVKLLRVLQEKEIEHVGGMKTIRINVRVIAATNRNLQKEIAEGRFRLDLFYRLNVFPIEMPALNERKEDIPLLANYFLDHYVREMNSSVMGFSKDAMNQLMRYDYPGNIRELAHLVERSLLMTSGKMITEINMPRAISSPETTPVAAFQIKTMEQMEADYILTVLKHCNGKVCGSGGAAEILDLAPSTLNSRIKKLGIRRESYFNL